MSLPENSLALIIVRNESTTSVIMELCLFVALWMPSDICGAVAERWSRAFARTSQLSGSIPSSSYVSSGRAQKAMIHPILTEKNEI